MTDANLSQIVGNISNLNVTYSLNTSDILNTAINTSNTTSNGWVGLIVLGIFTSAILIYIIKNKDPFKVQSEIALLLLTLNIILDIGFILYQYRIVYTLQPILWLFTAFTCVCVFSLLRKEAQQF